MPSKASARVFLYKSSSRLSLILHANVITGGPARLYLASTEIDVGLSTIFPPMKVVALATSKGFFLAIPTCEHRPSLSKARKAAPSLEHTASTK